MHGIFIGCGMHRNCCNAKLAAGSEYPKGDLAAVGYQDLFDHFPAVRLFKHDERFIKFDRLAVFNQNFNHPPSPW